MGVRRLAIGAAILVSSAPVVHMTPQTEPSLEALLTNGQIRARIYLPDLRRGFYRSTRFDWSGTIAALEYQGHRYYGPWFTKRDPSVRDFIYKDADIVVSDQSAMVGPAEEFRTALGYASATTGGTFVKIGVGVLRKPEETRYSPYTSYELVDSGKWSVHSESTRTEASQEVSDPGSGYGYAYRKIIRLAADRPQLILEHSLRNTGRLPIQTRQYNHNFLVLDNAATGPDFVVEVPFAIKTANPPDGRLAAIEGNRIVYRKLLEDQDRVSFGVQGYGSDVKDYDVRVENRALGAGVRITADRPLANLSLWSIRSVLSMEPDVDINLEPGASMNWTYTYTYYTIPR